MLIAALLAVLLAEAGGKLARRDTATPARIALSVAIVIAASFAGYLSRSYLTAWAGSFLIGIVMMLAAVAQLRAKEPVPAKSLFDFARIVWSSAVPLTLFALAAFGGAAVTTAIGGALGLIAAAALAPLATPLVRRVAGGFLLAAGIVLLLSGLRLI